MTFATWKFAGKQYLAAPASGGFHVIDEEGNNYGAWMCLQEFRKRQREGGEWSPLGKAMVQVMFLSNK
jgi:tetrahydromethanopterin S-methyltransferase subunit H